MFEAVQAKSLISATKEELLVFIPKLSTFYDELSEKELLRNTKAEKAAKIHLEEGKDWSVLDILKFMAEWHFLESLPYLSVSLQLFVTICVSVASRERSFSNLKL
jgi:hypothetical protein